MRSYFRFRFDPFLSDNSFLRFGIHEAHEIVECIVVRIAQITRVIDVHGRQRRRMDRGSVFARVRVGESGRRWLVFHLFGRGALVGCLRRKLSRCFSGRSLARGRRRRLVFHRSAIGRRSCIGGQRRYSRFLCIAFFCVVIVVYCRRSSLLLSVAARVSFFGVGSIGRDERCGRGCRVVFDRVPRRCRIGHLSETLVCGCLLVAVTYITDGGCW
mmetsp:Transcript_20969/g.34086  ORF Transcript_20969/g.34086 Transcript_20969/m.34086 type:complete len:214 (+) Transcript_20969:1346-1987(+)